MDCQLLKRYDNVVHNLNVKIFNLKKETKDKKRQKQQITIDVLNSLTELEYSMNQLKVSGFLIKLALIFLIS